MQRINKPELCVDRGEREMIASRHHARSNSRIAYSTLVPAQPSGCRVQPEMLQLGDVGRAKSYGNRQESFRAKGRCWSICRNSVLHA